MEAKIAQSLILSPGTGSEKSVRGPSGSVRFSRRRSREPDRFHQLVSAQWQPKTSPSNRLKAVSCSYKNFPGILQKIKPFIFTLM